jgi:hypothetical protein
MYFLLQNGVPFSRKEFYYSMDIIEALKATNAFSQCEKFAEEEWQACLKERNKPRTDAGCLYLKNFATIVCIGDAKQKLTKENQLLSSHNTGSGAGRS